MLMNGEDNNMITSYTQSPRYTGSPMVVFVLVFMTLGLFWGLLLGWFVWGH